MGGAVHKNFYCKRSSCCSIRNRVIYFAKGRIKKRVKKAPSHLELPELPMSSFALIADEQRENDARDVFISYLEVELNNLK